MQESGVLLITLNRPEQLNSLNEALLAELRDVWPIVSADDNVRVVVITGAGTSFSVGGDMELVSTFPEELAESVKSSNSYAATLRGLMDLQKPVVAAINGNALGGGLGIALLCDVIFMARHARLMCGSQLNINVFPAPEAFLWRMRGVADAKAKYHLLRSDTLSAEVAERIGLISCVVKTEDLLSEALAYAVDIAKRDPVMMSWTKRALNYGLRSSAPLLDEWLSLEALSFGREAVKPALAKVRKKIGKKGK